MKHELWVAELLEREREFEKPKPVEVPPMTAYDLAFWLILGLFAVAFIWKIWEAVR